MSPVGRRGYVVMLTATFLGIAGLGGLNAHAGDVTTCPLGERDLSFQLTKDSVHKAGPVFVGDLRLENRNPTEAIPALDDREELQRCIREAPEWLQWSEDGTTIEVTKYASPRDTVLTVYCDDRVVLVGGYSQMTPDNSPAGRQEWLFVVFREWQVNPAKVSVATPLAVGQPPQQVRYTLNELRLIDPESGRMVFSGTSENGERALLSAPFAITRGEE